MHTKPISWEGLRKKNKLTFLLKHSRFTMEWFVFWVFLDQIGSFFTVHLTLSDGTLVRHSTVVWKKHCGG